MAGNGIARILVTGAAGFIGSHLVERLLAENYEVVGLDDFSTGRQENLPPIGTPRFHFVRGDLCDPTLCRMLCEGVSAVLHQAAHNSALRSFSRPRESLMVNLLGLLTLLEAARDAGVQRVVYASSSSVYGPQSQVPCREQDRCMPRSPYAISKLAAEELAQTFSAEYQLVTIGLRYFNVFGPRQSTCGEYGAVVPRFIKACLRGDAPVIFGDGSAARDFTYIENVVDANLRALLAETTLSGRVYNIGCGTAHTIKSLYDQIAEQLGPVPLPVFDQGRRGDARSSLADLSAAMSDLGYRPRFDLLSGLIPTIAWYKETLSI